MTEEKKFFRIGPGRLSFCYPRGRKDRTTGELKYGSQILLTPEIFKSCKDVQLLINAVNKLGKERVSDKYELKTARNKCIQKCDEIESMTDEQTKGLICFKSTSKGPIKMYGPDGKDMDEEDVKKIRSGHWGYLIVNPFAYEAGGNKGVSLGCVAIQYWKADKEFGNFEKAIASCIETLEVPVVSPESYEEVSV